MQFLDKYNSYSDLQKQILGILLQTKKIEIDDLGYFTHRLLRYIDFEAYVRIDKIPSRHEQKDELVVYTQFLLDDGWCLLDEKNFILKEENENEKLKQTISVDREKWRLKMIQDVCNYVEIEENDPVVKGLHEMDRANFIRKF